MYSDILISETKLLSLGFKLVPCQNKKEDEVFSIDNKLNFNAAINLEEKTADITSILVINDQKQEKKPPFTLKASFITIFKWNKDYSEEEIKEYFDNNLLKLILPEIKPMISDVTGWSPFPAYELPLSEDEG